MKVVVTHEGDKWLAEIPEVPGTQTYAGNLPNLEKSIREALGLMLDLETDYTGPLDWDYSRVSPSVQSAADRATRRNQIRKTLSTLTEASNSDVRELIRAGWSTRDVAAMTSLTSGRVSQIIHEKTTT